MNFLQQLIDQGFQQRRPSLTESHRTRQDFINAGKLDPDFGEFRRPQIVDPATEALTRAARGMPEGPTQELIQPKRWKYSVGGAGNHYGTKLNKNNPLIDVQDWIYSIFGGRFK